jgi:DnaJ-class molecular chaperone
MNNEREIFLKKINEFIISSQNNKKELKSAYLQLVKEYHPDKNNRLDKEILNEYMIIINNAYNEIIKKPGKIKLKDKQNSSGYFYINAFCQLLSKIKTISSNSGKTNDPKEGEYRNLVIKEISKYNKESPEQSSGVLKISP